MTRDKQYLDMLNQWLILKQEEKSIQNYLNERKYHTIAIYGMGLYGRHVIRELQRTETDIVYGIDRKKLKPYKGVEVLQPTAALPRVDAIINTVIHEHANIQKALASMTDIPVLSLEDIIFESYE